MFFSILTFFGLMIMWNKIENHLDGERRERNRRRMKGE